MDGDKVKNSEKNARLKLLLLWILPALLIVMAGWVIGKILALKIRELITITGFVLAVVLVLALLFYFFSAQILLRWYHAKEVQDKNSPVCEIVHRLATKADIPVPKVFIVESAMPNAFAVGRNRKNAAIVVTSALTELLDKEEIEAVLAHELTHVKNGDTLIGTEVAVLSGTLTAFATIAFWGSIFTGFGQEDDPAPNIIKIFVTSLVAPIAAVIIQLALSKSREYVADEQSVRMHDGKTDKLASALHKIDERLKSGTFEVNPAHVHLFIMNPLHDDEFTVMDFRLPTYHFLFHTHPATGERVERLKKTGRNDKEKEWRSFGLIRPLFFSFISYLFVLFVIIVIDTFSRKDFVFARAAAISAVYLGVLLVLFAIMVVVFRVKLKNHEISRD